MSMKSNAPRCLANPAGESAAIGRGGFAARSFCSLVLAAASDPAAGLVSVTREDWIQLITLSPTSDTTLSGFMKSPKERLGTSRTARPCRFLDGVEPRASSCASILARF